MKTNKTINFTPVGVSFKDTAPNINLLEVGSEVTFEHRPAFYGSGERRKEYPNAVVVLFGDKKVGSLAESDLAESPQQMILSMIKSGKSPKGRVIELIIPSDSDTFKKTFKLSVDVPKLEKESNGNVLMKSFNEEGVIVTHNVKKHTYDLKGESFTPVTNYIKKYFKEFDTNTISKYSATAWKVEQQDVVDLWESNSKVSQLFGTTVHMALEHYEKYQSLGQIISDTKKLDENYAMPKHPILKSIIKGFVEINPIKGDVHTEQLVTSVKHKVCGLADRIVILDLDKKIARIGDYKINVGSEDIKEKVLPPFSHLPANKISKYQIQLSVYANMLQMSGWNVTGLDVYVYEGEWKYFELDVLQVL